MVDIPLNRDQYLELEKIALGAFAPLNGFMNEDEFKSVVEEMRLPDGAVFPLPVVLDLTPAQALAVKGQAVLILTFEGEEIGEISPESFFSCHKKDVAMKVFGTDEIAHPGVAHLYDMGEVFVGGPIKLIERAKFDFSDYEFTPEQTKAIFKERGWKRVVGFQTRNVPHRAHEYLQRVALEHCDGLFIQPLVGRKKVGDYTAEAIMSSFQTLIDQFLRPEKVLLGALSTSMRYAGPREALFHAIIRRNYGCSHFIVGRDHAGVGSYYGKYEAHDLTRRFDSELGIQVLRLHGPYYCRECDGIVTEHTCPHGTTKPEEITEISGTMMRAMLVDGAKPERHIMRPELIASLKNIPLFITENDL